MRTKKFLSLLLSAAMALSLLTATAFAAAPAEEENGFFDFLLGKKYTYLYAALTWDEYWANEKVYAAGSTAASAQLDSHEEHDLGAFDAVSRATANHGLHRGSFQSTAVIYAKDGSTYTVSHWSDDGKTIYLADGTTVGWNRGTITKADGSTVQMDHYEVLGTKYVPVRVATSDLADFCSKYTVVENGGQLVGGYSEKNLTAYTLTAAVDKNTNGLKYATKSGDGYTFSAAHTGTGSGVAEAAQKAADGLTVNLRSGSDVGSFGEFIRVDLNGNYGELGSRMQSVVWTYYGNDSTYTHAKASYGTKFAADNWMHKSMGIQLGLSDSARCQLPEGTDGTGYWTITIRALGYADTVVKFQTTAENLAKHELASDADRAALQAVVAEAQGKAKAAYTADSYASLHFAKEDMDPDYWKDTGLEGDRSAAMYFLRDEDFRQLLRDNGLPEEDYFRPDAPQAVAWDMLDIWRSTEGSKYNKLYHYHLLNGSSLPITGTESSYQPMDGWFTEGDRITRDGTEYVLYYPEDYIDDYYIARSEGEVPDESRAQAVPASEAVLTRSYTVGAILKEAPDFLGTGDLYLLYPYSMYEAVTGQAPAADAFWFRSSDHAASYESMGQILMELGNSRSELQDLAANGENQRAMVTVVNVFSYGFIILISLISMTNVFNTISTSIALRRREFAMLRSVGLTQRGFARMMDYECIIYGARALLWGLPASVLVTYGIYRSVAQSIAARFYIPWYSVAIAVGSVFVVVFATMLYATRKIRSENPIEALKQENL